MYNLWKKYVDPIFSGNAVLAAGSTMNIAGTLKIGGVAVTPSAAELNTMKGITATVGELNYVADASARVVTTTATALNLTVTQHSERILLVNTNSTVANTFTLPVATGSGARFTVVNNVQQTQGSVVVAANGTADTMKGVAFIAGTTATAAEAFLTSASSDKVTFNAGTSGGLGGDTVEAVDVAANTWMVRVFGAGSGSIATPFSQT